MGLKEKHLLRLAHADKIGFRHVRVRHGVVRVGVEHDEREGQQVCAVGGGKDAGVVTAVALGKLLHDAVDLLRLACSKCEDVWFHTASDTETVGTEAQISS